MGRLNQPFTSEPHQGESAFVKADYGKTSQRCGSVICPGSCYIASGPREDMGAIQFVYLYTVLPSKGSMTGDFD